MIAIALACQVVLLLYHQVTTLVDLHPFNGVRHASRAERFAEAGVNLVLMGLAPLGFALSMRGLMVYGAIYYPVLFVLELVIWWVPYFGRPSGRWGRAHGVLLAVATTDFAGGDTLGRWAERHVRLHRSTLTPWPRRRGPIVPNLEHTILHVWTFVTALATLAAMSAQGPR